MILTEYEFGSGANDPLINLAEEFRQKKFLPIWNQRGKSCSKEESKIWRVL